MIRSAGFLWDSPQLFGRYLQDCGIRCEVITPHLLAAPFFRSQYVALIIPTGFANRAYSCLLPALRARSARFRTFVERGGRLLVFGASTTEPGAYDWLWFRAEYVHGYGEKAITFCGKGAFPPLVAADREDRIACDGYFAACEGEPLATDEEGRVVMFSRKAGAGLVLLTTLHEYPSRAFLAEFCSSDRETLF